MGGASRLGQGIRGAGLLLARRTGEREHIMLSTRSCATGACSTSLASRRSLKRRPTRTHSDACPVETRVERVGREEIFHASEERLAWKRQ